MERYLEKYIKDDLKEKIILLSGPRQVGKTILSKQLIPSNVYLNYDSTLDRKIIYAQEWTRNVPLVIFDELHKMKKWKSWIKGIYDTEGIPPSLIVTGYRFWKTCMSFFRFDLRNVDEITSPTMHHSFRPPLSGLKSQKY